MMDVLNWVGEHYILAVLLSMIWAGGMSSVTRAIILALAGRKA